MRTESVNLLKKLTLLDGVPGFEDEVRDFIRQQLEGCGTFELDNLGSLICKKVGRRGGPRIMFPAHMDEIGFMVRDVTDEGYLKFSPLGGWLDQTLLAHVVTVHTRKGRLTGTIGCPPPHLIVPRQQQAICLLYNGFTRKEETQQRTKRAQPPTQSVRPWTPALPTSHGC